jgi:hypothetical protein
LHGPISPYALYISSTVDPSLWPAVDDFDLEEGASLSATDEIEGASMAECVVCVRSVKVWLARHGHKVQMLVESGREESFSP